MVAVFGGKQVLSERRRQLADRRQQARSFVAGFVEEVRFEADGRLASLLDDVQRQMRARFAERIRSSVGPSPRAPPPSSRASRAGRHASGSARVHVLSADLARIDDLGSVPDSAAARPDWCVGRPDHRRGDDRGWNPGSAVCYSQDLSIVLWRGNQGTVTGR